MPKLDRCSVLSLMHVQKSAHKLELRCILAKLAAASLAQRQLCGFPALSLRCACNEAHSVEGFFPGVAEGFVRLRLWLNEFFETSLDVLSCPTHPLPSHKEMWARCLQDLQNPSRLFSQWVLLAPRPCGFYDWRAVGQGIALGMTPFKRFARIMNLKPTPPETGNTRMRQDTWLHLPK